MNFEEFTRVLRKVWQQQDPISEIRNALEVFDPTGNGFFTVDQLKSMLLEFGENLEEDEFKEFTKTITIQPDGTINMEGR